MSRQIPPELEARLREALQAGRRDEARAIFREATGASERMAQFAVFLMSTSKVARWSEPPASSGDDGSGSAPPAPSASPPTPASMPSDDRRSAVRASSGCGSVLLLSLAPILAAILWI